MWRKSEYLHHIYKLVHKGQVVYVGKTINTLIQRFRLHKCKPSEPLKDIIDQCEIELIESTTDVSRERYWINHYKELGCNLCNQRPGDGRTREERLEYLREYDKKRYKKSRS